MSGENLNLVCIEIANAYHEASRVALSAITDLSQADSPALREAAEEHRAALRAIRKDLERRLA